MCPASSPTQIATIIHWLSLSPSLSWSFHLTELADEEAELSADEDERVYFMDGEDEDAYDEDADEYSDDDGAADANVPSSGRLRRQVEKVYHRQEADQDQRELRFLKVTNHLLCCDVWTIGLAGYSYDHWTILAHTSWMCIQMAAIVSNDTLPLTNSLRSNKCTRLLI